MGRARYRSQYRTGTTYRTIHQRNAFYATPAIWIFYGLITFGIMYPVAAFLFFRRARQTAAAADAGTPFRARYLRPPASRLTVWALVYSGLTVVAAAIAIAAGAHSSQPSTPPFVQLTEPLGGTATIQDEVALNPGGVAPVALTVSTFSDPAKAPGGGNVEAEVRVCATTKAIDPSLMADAFLLQPGGIDAQTYNVIESAVPASLQVQQLNPGQCASGTLSWLVPAGTQLQSVSYEGLQSVTWPVS